MTSKSDYDAETRTVDLKLTNIAHVGRVKQKLIVDLRYEGVRVRSAEERWFIIA